MNTVLFVNATIGFSENLFLVHIKLPLPAKNLPPPPNLGSEGPRCKAGLIDYVNFELWGHGLCLSFGCYRLACVLLFKHTRLLLTVFTII